MNEIKLPITRENRHLYHGDNTDDWIVIEEASWTVDRKNQYSFVIVSPVNNPSLFYCLYRSRSGPYYDDYDYSIDYLDELTLYPVEKITYSWKQIG